MNPRRFTFPLLAAATIVLTGPLAARADETTNTLKFSDPSKPGTVKISLGRGELRVQGAETNEVTIKSDAKVTNVKRKDGMRVISAATSYGVREADNVITLDATSGEWGGRGNSDFRLTVPLNTAVIVHSFGGGDIRCANLAGDIEISSMQGEIQLDDISGGVVAGTMNGQIKAGFRELREGRPISFTSTNGEITLRLPESSKANVRLRTQNGSVLTDFDENILVTKTEASSFSRGKSTFSYKGPKVLTVEIQEAIREATQLSATAVRETLEAVKQGLDAAKLDADDARRQVEDARRQLDRARNEVERAGERNARATASRSSENSPAVAPVPPVAPVAPVAPAAPSKPGAWAGAPKPAAITITGGKLVTGTLNGGGPEINVATMNGDVILRKTIEKK